MKNLWQYKHWPDHKNPDEKEPWIEGPPNPCTVFRVKWLEQIRSWARYVSGEFSENLLVMPPPPDPDPFTTEDIVQKASFWNFLLFTGDYSKEWDRYSGVSGETGGCNPTMLSPPEWMPFKVGDVLHPYAPDDVLLGRLAEFREYIEAIQAIEVHDHNSAVGVKNETYGSSISPKNAKDGSTVSKMYPFAIVDKASVNWIYYVEYPAYKLWIHGNTGDSGGGSGVGSASAASTHFVTKLLFQKNYRVALMSEKTSMYGVIPAPYNAWPTTGLYCHDSFEKLPREASNAWLDVDDIGRTDCVPSRVIGGQYRFLRYFLLIDDDLPESVFPSVT